MLTQKKQNNPSELTPQDPYIDNNIPKSSLRDGDCPPPLDPQLRDNERSACNNQNFRVYSHNVQGLRDESKLEAIPRIMKEKNIDVYLIQETHLVGDFEKTLIDNFFMIHHGPQEQPLRGAKGGVAIVLSPELTDLWKSSKKKQKIARGGTTIGDTTRILSISIRFKTNNPKPNKELTYS